MIYTNMLFALGLDKVVFGQSPGWWSLAGSGLILGSAIFVAVKKGQAQGQNEGCGAGERGLDVEMLGRGESGRPEEEMAMLRGGVDEEEEEEEEEEETIELDSGHQNARSKGVVESGREADVPPY